MEQLSAGWIKSTWIIIKSEHCPAFLPIGSSLTFEQCICDIPNLLPHLQPLSGAFVTYQTCWLISNLWTVHLWHTKLVVLPHLPDVSASANFQFGGYITQLQCHSDPKSNFKFFKRWGGPGVHHPNSNVTVTWTPKFCGDPYSNFSNLRGQTHCISTAVLTS